MTVRPIRVVGDPVLRTPCDPIRTVTDGTRTLVRDLLDTVDDPARAGGVVHGVEQVPHEGAGAVGDRADRVAGGAQDGVADDSDGTDGHACSSPGSAPSTRWVTSTPGTTLRSTVQPAATARSKTFTTVAISCAVSPSSGSCTSSAIDR